MERTNRSQGIVEFAVALPILLMLLFGIIDFSLLFSAWLLIQNMSRQAVRYAVTGDFNTAYCPGPDFDCKDADPAVQAQLVDAARLPSIRDTAYQFQTGLLIDPSHKDDGALSIPGFI
ncbi:MAG TPA: TadE family protein, partial [Anaerolineales bacterium]